MRVAILCVNLKVEYRKSWPMEEAMKKSVSTLLVFLALSGFTGQVGSSPAVSPTDKAKCENDLTYSPEFLPDLDPGTAYGWPQEFRDLNASNNVDSNPNCQAEASGMGSDQP